MPASTEWLYRDMRGVVHEVNDRQRRRHCDDVRWGYGTMRARDATYPTCLWCAADASR